MTLNDQVEAVHQILMNNERYRGFLSAIYDEQAVEGSLAADDIMAATMIRDEAKRLDMKAPITEESLRGIIRALGVVLRRYGQSRKERREATASG